MQVRIDDDVIPLLEASKAAHGGSLSKAANRLLRASAGKPRVVVTALTRPTGGTSNTSEPVSWPATTPKPSKRVGRCSHPLLRRVGSMCAVCQQKVGP